MAALKHPLNVSKTFFQTLSQTGVPHIPEPLSRLAPIPISANSIPEFPPSPVPATKEVQPISQFVTQTDEFGLFGVYPHNLPHEPDKDLIYPTISQVIFPKMMILIAHLKALIQKCMQN